MSLKGDGICQIINAKLQEPMTSMDDKFARIVKRFILSYYVMLFCIDLDYVITISNAKLVSNWFLRLCNKWYTKKYSVLKRYPLRISNYVMVIKISRYLSHPLFHQVFVESVRPFLLNIRSVN